MGLLSLRFIVTTCNIEGAQFVIQLIRLLLTKQRRQLKNEKLFYFLRHPNLFSPLEICKEETQFL